MMNEDQKWQALLSASKPAFGGDVEVPFGFVTRTMAQLREARREREQFDRISLRAFFASLAALAVVACITLGMGLSHHSDIESGVKSVFLADAAEIF